MVVEDVVSQFCFISGKFYFKTPLLSFARLLKKQTFRKNAVFSFFYETNKKKYIILLIGRRYNVYTVQSPYNIVLLKLTIYRLKEIRNGQVISKYMPQMQ